MSEPATDQVPLPQGKHAQPVDEAQTDQLPNGKAAHRTKVMLLGSGELGRELVIAFQRLGAEVIAVERYANAPAHGVAEQALVVKMTDTDELSAVIERLRPNYVVTVTDAVAGDALSAADEAGFTQVVPTAYSARLTADAEGMRRLAADELGLPTAPFWFAGSVDELDAVARHAGLPLRVQPVAPVGGLGQSVMKRPGDVEPAWQRAMSAGGPTSPNRVMAETVVEVDHEITLLAVRGDGPSGPVLDFCAPIGHRLEGGVLESWQPQQISKAALDSAKSVAARIVNALGGRGVFGVELLVCGDEVYFSDVTVRPCDSGLVTLRTQRLSQFELTARAVLGASTDTVMISPGAARVIYPGTEFPDAAAPGPNAVGALVDALSVPESDVLVFGHHEDHPRRRLGVALVTATDTTIARDRVRQVNAALSKFLQQ